MVSLKNLENYSDRQLEGLIMNAPRARDLRAAVEDFVKAIHGLPQIMGCELRQNKVYVGRAGATALHLRQRWKVRLSHEEFGDAPSTHAMVVVKAPTERIRENEWEPIAQRLVKSLDGKKALCCANAIVGGSGRYPESVDETVLYVVARVKPGPIPIKLPESSTAWRSLMRLSFWRSLSLKEMDDGVASPYRLRLLR